MNLKNPILADLRVRRALAYAINKHDLIAKISHGIDIPADTDQPPFLWAHNPNVMKYDYDPAKANALLDSAGWQMGSDGYRHKNGQTLELGMTGTTGAAETRNLEAVVQAEWQAVGVKGDVKNAASSLFFASYGAGGLLQTGKYDTGFYSWINGVDPDDSSLYMCKYIPPAGQNNLWWCDPKVDALENDALTTFDIEKRKQDYFEIQRELVDQAPTIVLFSERRVDTFTTHFHGYIPSPAQSADWNSWQWSME